MSSNNLLEEVERFKEEYYKTNRKNIFFKKSQKQDFARKVSDNFNLNELLEKTIYIDSQTNRVFIDYNVFKLYANADTYELIKNYTKNIFSNFQNKRFEFHIDINGFTISAAERYKSFFEMILSEFMISNEDIIYDNIFKIIDENKNLIKKCESLDNFVQKKLINLYNDGWKKANIHHLKIYGKQIDAL